MSRRITSRLLLVMMTVSCLCAIAQTSYGQADELLATAQPQELVTIGRGEIAALPPGEFTNQVQVLFSEPEGMQVRWKSQTGGPLLVPARHNFATGRFLADDGQASRP